MRFALYRLPSSTLRRKLFLCTSYEEEVYKVKSFAVQLLTNMATESPVPVPANLGLIQLLVEHGQENWIFVLEVPVNQRALQQ